MHRGSRHGVLLTALGLLGLFGCHTLLGLEEGRLQGECSLATDCAPGFSCWRGECRDACGSDDECGPGFRCVRSFNDSACEALDAGCGVDQAACLRGTKCDWSLSVPACFTLCGDDDDCAGGQRCESGLCRSDKPEHQPSAASTDGGVVAQDGPKELGQPCSTDAALACAGEAGKHMLVCDGSSWRSNGTCDATHNCNRVTGTCAPIASACTGRSPNQAVCDADEMVVCGPDLVTFSKVECDGACVEGEGPARCAAAGCGDGVRSEGEECDDGNPSNTDACTGLCERARCGDGFVWSDNEECDDGDDDDGDACLSNCKRATCGDGEVWVDHEDCDDGNQNDSDGCTNLCTRSGCGDGTVGAGELCDDGNLEGGDGCSARCKPEPVQLSAGDNFSCALLSDGSVKCWGENSFGQLGLGDTDGRGDEAGEMGAALSTVSLGSERKATSLASGDYHSCAVLDDGSLKCWGGNIFGQLGLEDTDWRGYGPGQMGDALPPVSLGANTIQQLGLGTGWSCAVLDSEALKCWGYNGQGQLGQGHDRRLGDQRGEMGEALAAVPLGGDRGARAVGARWGQTCALLDDATVKCWGINESGQLATGDTRWRGDEPDELGDALPAVDLGAERRVRVLAVGYLHVCVLLEDGEVKCWGGNETGQLGLGDTRARGDDPGELGEALPSVKLGNGRTAVDLIAAWDHTCALFDDGAIKCWGDNTAGQLGLGDSRARGDGPDEMGDALPTVDLGAGRRARSLTAGWRHTCALLDDGSVKCWGINTHGQLGLGDVRARGDDPDEMGDALPTIPLF